MASLGEGRWKQQYHIVRPQKVEKYEESISSHVEPALCYIASVGTVSFVYFGGLTYSVSDPAVSLSGVIYQRVRGNPNWQIQYNEEDR